MVRPGIRWRITHRGERRERGEKPRFRIGLCVLSDLCDEWFVLAFAGASLTAENAENAEKNPDSGSVSAFSAISAMNGSSWHSLAHHSPRRTPRTRRKTQIPDRSLRSQRSLR